MLGRILNFGGEGAFRVRVPFKSGKIEGGGGGVDITREVDFCAKYLPFFC